MESKNSKLNKNIPKTTSKNTEISSEENSENKKKSLFKSNSNQSKPKEKVIKKKTPQKTNQKNSQKPSDKKSVIEDNEEESELSAEQQYESRIYKDGAIEELNSRLNKIFILIIIALFILFLGASKNITIKPDNAYIPVDDNYNIVYGVEEEEPFKSEEIVNFANKAIEETFSFNYLNYNRRIENIYNTYYTSVGAQSLDRALSRRNFFKFLSDKSLKLVEARVLENALIIQDGKSSNNLSAWVLSVDIELTLLTTTERKEKYTYEIIVEQMPVQERRSQLGISSIQQK